MDKTIIMEVNKTVCTDVTEVDALEIGSSSGKGVGVMWYSRCRLSGDVIQSSSQTFVWLVEVWREGGATPWLQHWHCGRIIHDMMTKLKM